MQGKAHLAVTIKRLGGATDVAWFTGVDGSTLQEVTLRVLCTRLEVLMGRIPDLSRESLRNLPQEKKGF